MVNEYVHIFTIDICVEDLNVCTVDSEKRNQRNKQTMLSPLHEQSYIHTQSKRFNTLSYGCSYTTLNQRRSNVHRTNREQSTSIAPLSNKRSNEIEGNTKENTAHTNIRQTKQMIVVLLLYLSAKMTNEIHMQTPRI